MRTVSSGDDDRWFAEEYVVLTTTVPIDKINAVKSQHLNSLSLGPNLEDKSWTFKY